MPERIKLAIKTTRVGTSALPGLDVLVGLDVFAQPRVGREVLSQKRLGLVLVNGRVLLKASIEEGLGLLALETSYGAWLPRALRRWLRPPRLGTGSELPRASTYRWPEVVDAGLGVMLATFPALILC